MQKHIDLLTSKHTLWGLLIIAISAALTLFVFDTIGAENVHAFITQGGPLAPLVYIGFKAMTYVIAPLSSGPVVMLSGTIFGPWLGTLYSLLGDLIGGSINFWIAHVFGRAMIKRFTGAKGLTQVDHYYETVGEWKGLLFARIALSSFYDFISYAVGLTKLPYRQYLLVSALGGLLPTAYTVFFGATLLSNRWIFFGLLGTAFVALLILLLLKEPKRD